MVNFNFNFASISGIVLAVAGAALYFLRNFRPGVARDHDIFFAAIGLLSGFILIFQGWRYDPIMQFGQLLLTGTTVFFAVESVRLRSVATEQARRNTRIVDEERPVSSAYQYEAELDEYDPLEEERTIPRRIRGSRDGRSTQADDYDYEDEVPRRYRREEEEPTRRPSSRSSSTERIVPAEERTRSTSKRRPRPESRPLPSNTGEEDWGASSQATREDDWEEKVTRTSKPPRGSNGSGRVEKSDTEAPSRPRKRRPPQNSPQNPIYGDRDDVQVPSSDYVDYKPIERFDDDRDNSANFDEP
jgi:Ycf66 protein N-terminus